MKSKIAGAVILYEPSSDVVDNIRTYCHEVACLFVVDNSASENQSRRNSIAAISDNIVYVSKGINLGIARALNIACEMAISGKYEWLLTMDQDSKFSDCQAQSFINCIEPVLQLFPKTAIIGPYHQVHADLPTAFKSQYQEMKGTMTSGNLLNLNAYLKAGAFDDKLFIDYVDFEYCLRLRKMGYTIVQNNTVCLEHSLGNFRLFVFLGKGMGTSNHEPLRRYYIARNRVHIMFKYFSFDKMNFISESRNMFVDVSRIIIFEKNKFKKLKATIRGVWHALSGKFGKFEK